MPVRASPVPSGRARVNLLPVLVPVRASPVPSVVRGSFVVKFFRTRGYLRYRNAACSIHPSDRQVSIVPALLGGRAQRCDGDPKRQAGSSVHGGSSPPPHSPPPHSHRSYRHHSHTHTARHNLPLRSGYPTSGQVRITALAQRQGARRIPRHRGSSVEIGSLAMDATTTPVSPSPSAS